MCSNPLRRSEEQIRADMLKLTPIGMNMDDVIKIIGENPKWEIRHIRDWIGYGMAGGRPTDFTSIEENIVGVKSIRVYLGQYRRFFAVGVSVFYGFDENSKLIDIAVLKETDGL